MSRLHVVNGTTTAGHLRAIKIDGAVLPWADILIEGPITNGLQQAADWQRRADELQRRLRIPRDSYLDSMRRCHDRLAAFTQDDEVVLWFEEDLFCQVHLLYLLAWFAGRDLGRTRLSLIAPAEPLAGGDADALAAQFAERRAVSAARLALAQVAWHAYAAADPRACAALRDADLAAWPALRGALRRHLERLPSTATGLNVIETTALRLLLAGEQTFPQLFMSVSAAPRLAGFGMGDVQLAGLLVELAGGDHPLVSIEGFDGDANDDQFAGSAGWRLRTTPLARTVCAEEADAVLVRGIDRWVGGTHLSSRGTIWRWDAAHARVVA